MWCVPEITPEFIDRMEDLLRLFAKPKNPPEPVICLDERPVQLLDSQRAGSSARPGRIARRDYEYIRQGTANVFCVIEPKAGRRQTRATPNRAGPAFARALRR